MNDKTELGTLKIGRKNGESFVIGNILFVVMVVNVNHNFVDVLISGNIHKISDGREVRINRNQIYSLSSDVSMTYLYARGAQARFGVTAPRDIPINRTENLL